MQISPRSEERAYVLFLQLVADKQLNISNLSFDGLRPSTCEALRGHIKNYCKIYHTHNLQDVEDLSQYVLVMRERIRLEQFLFILPY